MRICSCASIFPFNAFGTGRVLTDALSRQPLPNTGEEECETDYVEVFLTELDMSPVTAEEVKIQSRKDPVIAKNIDYILTHKLGEVQSPDFKHL